MCTTLSVVIQYTLTLLSSKYTIHSSTDNSAGVRERLKAVNFQQSWNLFTKICI